MQALSSATTIQPATPQPLAPLQVEARRVPRYEKAPVRGAGPIIVLLHAAIVREMERMMAVRARATMAQGGMR